MDEEGPDSPEIDPLLGSSEDDARKVDMEADLIDVFSLPIRPARPENTEGFIQECTGIPGGKVESCSCHKCTVIPTEERETNSRHIATPTPGPSHDRKRKMDHETEMSTPNTRGPTKKLRGQPVRNGPNATPSYMRKAIRQICEPRVSSVSKSIKETPTLHMEYRSKKPDSQDFTPSYEEDIVMDVGAMSSLMPLKIAEENGFTITKPKKKITL